MRVLRLPVLGFAVLCVSVAIAAPSKKAPSTAKVEQQKPASSSDAVISSPTKLSEPRLEDASLPAPTDLGNSPGQDVSAAPIFAEPFPPASASASGGDPVNMNWYSINNGGAIEVAAGNIKMGLSIGQNAVGEVQAGNIKMGLGFWYGASVCPCRCHADPRCDGETDIFDVTEIVNVAFRGFPPILDSNLSCEFETTNVDCIGSTDVFDVIRMVNVAFRGGDPAVEFCNPCAPPPVAAMAVPIELPDEKSDSRTSEQ